MAVKDPDDKIQKITRLLEKGGTMLATHHECGAPMFRYQGKIGCPVCDFQEKEQINELQETGKTDKQQTGQIQQKKEIAKTTATRSADVPVINKIIMNKVYELTVSLENETELGRVRDKMECIEQGIKILKLLRETN